MAVRYGSMPFKKQVEFFKGKVNLPTAAFTDVWEGQHARAFVVAGAMKSELLVDFRAAVDKAITQGTTLAEFRRDFDGIVAKHGWPYNGSRGWRTRVIYDTNLQTSYMAGRYEQMKKLARVRPYWMYMHDDSVKNPRPEHEAWHGLVLPHDDEWWSTHYPPNGWGCKCFVRPISKRQLEELGKAGPDSAPKFKWERKTVGKTGPTPRTVKVPEGIDPGWGYSVGEATWGKRLTEDKWRDWQDKSTLETWETLTPGDWNVRGRPKVIPRDPTSTPLMSKLDNTDEVKERLRTILGGEEKVFRVAGEAVLVNADTLGAHIPPRRAGYLALLPELLSDPFEVWLAFEKHRGTDQVVLRMRIIKALQLKNGRHLMLVAHASNGKFEGHTVMSGSNLEYYNKFRKGHLVAKR